MEVERIGSFSNAHFSQLETVVLVKRGICLCLAICLLSSGLFGLLVRKPVSDRPAGLADAILAMKNLKAKVSAHANFARQIAETLDALKSLSGYKKTIQKDRGPGFSKSPAMEYVPASNDISHIPMFSGRIEDRLLLFSSRHESPSIPPPETFIA